MWFLVLIILFVIAVFFARKTYCKAAVFVWLIITGHLTGGLCILIGSVTVDDLRTTQGEILRDKLIYEEMVDFLKVGISNPSEIDLAKIAGVQLWVFNFRKEIANYNDRLLAIRGNQKSWNPLIRWYTTKRPLDGLASIGLPK